MRLVLSLAVTLLLAVLVSARARGSVLSLIEPTFLADIPSSGYLFALLALLLARPVSLSVAMAGGPLDRREFAVAAWFGPKGFASVVYGLLILQSAIDRAGQLFHLVALVTAASIVAHSSTDVVVASWFRRAEEAAGG